MDDYPSNSHSRSKPEAKPVAKEKKVERVISGDVVRRKKPLGKRFGEVFGGGDARGVWSFVAANIMLPAAKDMVADSFSTGVERLLFGDTHGASRRSGSRSGSGSNGYVAYNRYAPISPSQSRNREESRPVSRRARANHDFDEIILATRVEAEEVIDRLYDLVSRYDSATVSDLYELVGVEGSFTDEKYGWTTLPGAGVSRVREGYLLNLPKPEPLD